MKHFKTTLHTQQNIFVTKKNEKVQTLFYLVPFPVAKVRGDGAQHPLLLLCPPATI